MPRIKLPSRNKLGRFQSPPAPGRTRYPRGRHGSAPPEAHPVRPKVPGTRDRGLKAGPFQTRYHRPKV